MRSEKEPKKSYNSPDSRYITREGILKLIPPLSDTIIQELQELNKQKVSLDQTPGKVSSQTVQQVESQG